MLIWGSVFPCICLSTHIHSYMLLFEPQISAKTRHFDSALGVYKSVKLCEIFRSKDKKHFY